MKTSVKVWFRFGMGLLALGLVTAGIGLAMAKGDFNGVFPAATQLEATKDFSGDEITGLVINADYNGISLVPSEDEDIRITYYEEEKGDYSFAVANHILTVEPVHKPWWQQIGIFLYQPKTMVIEVPKTIESITANAAAGSFAMEGITLKDDLVVESDAGAVTLKGVASKNLRVDSSAGSVILDQVTTGQLKISASAGRVSFTDVTAKDASVNASAGKVTGQNITVAGLTIESDAGAVVLNTVTAETAKIKTSAGKIEFAKLAVARALTLDSDCGAIRGSLYGDLTDFTVTTRVEAGESNLPPSYQGGAKTLDVFANAGAVEINFLK